MQDLKAKNNMNKTSILIPSCNEIYLQKTIDSLLENAVGNIEIIVYLDEFWPNSPIEDNDNVILIHHCKRMGMRPAINACARVATGKYLMKLDAHCIVDKGFDEKLKQDCDYKDAIVPRRYKLDEKKWQRKDKYYEFERIDTTTLKGRKWPEYADRVEGQDLPELMTFQGSCWFMHRDRFFNIGCLDDKNYGSMGREAQEICLKIWLSGGKCLLSRKTWYAHWSKPKQYVFANMNNERKKSEEYAIDFWKNNKWDKQTRSFEWLVDRFALGGDE